jgi:hypothetical protein
MIIEIVGWFAVCCLGAAAITLLFFWAIGLLSWDRR